MSSESLSAALLLLVACADVPCGWKHSVVKHSMYSCLLEVGMHAGGLVDRIVGIQDALSHMHVTPRVMGACAQMIACSSVV